MKAYAYEHTMKENGMLTLKRLPFNIGERIEVIIIPRSKFKGFRKVPFDSALAFAPSSSIGGSITLEEKRYPFWGKPITYPDPTDSVAEADWEIYK